MSAMGSLSSLDLTRLREALNKTRKLLSRCVAEGDHLDRRVPYFFEETIERRPFEQDLPAAERRLSEDHVGDAFAFGELDEAIGRLIGLHADHRRTEAFRE